MYRTLLKDIPIWAEASLVGGFSCLRVMIFCLFNKQTKKIPVFFSYTFEDGHWDPNLEEAGLVGGSSYSYVILDRYFFIFYTRKRMEISNVFRCQLCHAFTLQTFWFHPKVLTESFELFKLILHQPNHDHWNLISSSFFWNRLFLNFYCNI